METQENQFDFTAFAKEVTKAIKGVKPLIEKEEVFTPWLKTIVESSLEGELDAHSSKTKASTKTGETGSRAMANEVASATHYLFFLG